jgi:hypothetical protein
MVKGASGRIEEITPSEAEAGYWVAHSWLFLFENSQYQNSLGFLPDEHWQRSRAGIKALMQDPMWGPWIRKASIDMQPSFRAIIDEIDKELAAEAGS